MNFLRDRTSSAGAIGILIEHVETNDLEDGSPVVPGFVDDGVHWSLAQRADALAKDLVS